MKQPVNRIENEMEAWLAKEQRFAKLFSADIVKSSDFQKEKIAYMKGIQSRYSTRQLNADEQLSLRVLKRESNRIEKQLYPNTFIRLIRKGFNASVKLVADIRKKQLQSANERFLQNQISAMGMSEMTGRLREHLAKGEDRFNLPVSRYKNENQRMDYDLSFARKANGTYQIESFKVAMKDHQNTESRHHKFDGNGITASQASNLVAGRAVQIKDKWVQLDLNDKDTEGNFKMKAFHSGYGYDLAKAVAKLPLKELKDEQSKQKLMDALANGERQNVTIRVNGKDRPLSIEANPQFKTINIFDDQNKKISLSAALQKEVKIQTRPTRTIRLGKKSGVAVG